MFATTDMRFRRVADIPMGNLVARRAGGRFEFGAVVRAPGFETEVRGILYFSVASAQVGTPMPVFEGKSVNGYAIDFGVKPEMVWSGNLETLSEHGPPHPIGCMAIVGGVPGLSARVIGHGPLDEPIYWDILSGEILEVRDSRDTILVNEWRVGRRDVNNTFQELAKFAVPTPGAT